MFAVALFVGALCVLVILASLVMDRDLWWH